jgi:hypothetical protein
MATHGNFGFNKKADISNDNIWANMDFYFRPSKTKGQVRKEQRDEAIQKHEEEKREKEKEHNDMLKNLEELRSRCGIQVNANGHMTIQQPVQQKKQTAKQTKAQQATKKQAANKKNKK